MLIVNKRGAVFWHISIIFEIHIENMEPKDLLLKAAYYRKLIEETKKMCQTADNSGFWKLRLAEMEKVLSLIELNMTLRSACQQIREPNGPKQFTAHVTG